MKKLIVLLALLFFTSAYAEIVEIPAKPYPVNVNGKVYPLGFYKRAQANDEYLNETKADKSTTYTKAETDALVPDISVKADSDVTYTKTEVDALVPDISIKADADTTYTKIEVDALVPDISTKADASTTYTKTEVDTAIGNVSVGGTTIEADGVDNTKAAKAVLADGLAPGADLEVSSVIVTAVDGQNGLRGVMPNTVGSVIPIDGEYGLVPINDGTWQTITNGILAPIGSGSIDAYTKTESDTALSLKANQATTYTKAEVDALIALVSNGSDVIAPVVALGTDLTHDGTGTTFEITSVMVTEENLDTVDYNWDGGTSVEISLPFTVTAPANTEDHTLNVTATDLSSLTGSDAISFVYSGGAQTFDYNFDFSETGTPSTGTWGDISGTIDYDYDLAGDESLRLSNASAPSTVSLTLDSTMASCYSVYRLSLEASLESAMFYLYNEADEEIAAIYRGNTGNFYIREPDTTIISVPVSISDSTVCYVWVETHSGSGSDGVISLRVGTTKSRPTEAYTVSDGITTGGLRKVKFRAFTNTALNISDIAFNSTEFTEAP